MAAPSTPFDFDGLFVFEMANNHQGSVSHGIRIVEALADVANQAGVRGAVKLQFRDLDTFIHPAHLEGNGNKHVRRFLSTRLDFDGFAAILRAVRDRGMTTVCTPFDEASVEAAQQLTVDVLKVASCSAHDWPLLEAIAQSGRPVICSTGGLEIADVDKTVSFLQHRGVQFALMHCVSLYPTPPGQMNLNHIEVLRDRYPGVSIGLSGHELPTDFDTIRVAYAKGARLFEKHVGIPTAEAPLNSYSAEPEQLRGWLSAYASTATRCGNGRRIVTDQERSELQTLMRGVYAKRPVPKGSRVTREDVFFAMPVGPGQLSTAGWRDDLVADADYAPGQPLATAIRANAVTKKEVVYNTIHAVKGMLNQARVRVGYDVTSIELSHHYGLGRFFEVGCVIIECFNREYAKKVIVQLPGQRNPMHYHRRKDETFCVLDGVVRVDVEGKERVLHPGDVLWVPRGILHGFYSPDGSIFEEISTHSDRGDSFYNDPAIAATPLDERKTRLYNWGRHQFDEWSEDDVVE